MGASQRANGVAVPFEQLRNPSSSPQPVKVLVFIETIFIRGAAKTLLMFLDAMQAHSVNDGMNPFSFSLATFHRGRLPQDSAPTEFLEAVRKRGIKTYLIPERHRWDPRVLRLIHKVVAEADPDIIQTNNVKSHALIKAAGVHRTRRWIAFHHGYTSTDFKMKCYNQLDRWSLRSAERVVVPCLSFRSQLYSCGVEQERTRILHNAGIVIPAPPTREVQALRARFHFQPDAKILLTVGRMSREKGQIDLIQAMKVLSEKYPMINCHLLLLGFGPELPILRAAVGKLGLGPRVVFATDEKDVVPFLHLADAFALPSYSEGSPHVILEAMGAGVPIVATSVGGIPEILTDGQTGLLVKPRNPQGLAAALARLLQSPTLGCEYAQRARHVLKTTFSPQTYVKELLSIYAEVIAPSVRVQAWCTTPMA
jgi:glycosyltransferase involved in cell wall biosynthesis